MAFNFNADDIFEIAEQIEEKGAAFYTNASEQISDAHYKKLLLDLASMEIDHRKTFSSIRQDLSEKEKAPTVFDPMDESAQYLKALADLRVFYGKELNIASIEAILLDAISIEKDSIVFYLGMIDLVPKGLGKDKIDKIINEEKKHIRLLSNELIAFKK